MTAVRRGMLGLLLLLSVVSRAGARGGGGCFVAGTPVLRPDGSTVPIESVHAGDSVLAFDVHRHVVSAVVRELIAVEADGYLSITTDRTTVGVTAEHPMFVGDGFAQAGTLKAGDSVYSIDSDSHRGAVGFNAESRPDLVPATIRSIRVVPGPVTVYNLHTDDPHTFFAGGLAVHNKGGGGGGCFTADTPVLRSDGSSVPIASVQPGDTITAFDGDRLTSAVVRELIAIEAEEYLTITTDRAAIRVTAEHPFFVGDGRFTPAKLLRPGGIVFRLDGGRLVPATVRSIRVVFGPTTVYNLHTDDPHTFFAGGFAVHNKGGGGGGHGFSSGSHSSGGGSNLPGWIGFLLFGGFFSFILFIIIMAIRQRRSNGGAGGVELDFVHPAAAVRPKAEATEKLLGDLARSDVTLSPTSLRNTVTQTFLTLQTCWQSRDNTPMKPLVTPGLYTQHRGQLAAMKSQHEINVIDNARVDDVAFVHVGRATHGYEVTALITATARDYYVDDRTNRFLRGDRRPAQFQEFWTFRKDAGRWQLRQIEQSMESRKLAEPNDVGASNISGPAGPWDDHATAAATNDATALAQRWSATDPAWEPANLVDQTTAAFTASMLAPRTDGTELRNFNVRHVDIVVVHRFIDRSKDQFVARIAAHGQTVVGNVAQDPDVRAYLRYAIMARDGAGWKLKAILSDEDAALVLSEGNADER